MVADVFPKRIVERRIDCLLAAPSSWQVSKAHHSELARIRHWQASAEDFLEQLEYPRGRADAKRERQHRNGGEAWAALKLAESEADVLPERLRCIPPPHLPASLLCQSHVAESAQCRIPGLRR